MSLAGVEDAVRDRLGLDPGSVGRTALHLAVEARMKARGAKSLAEYAGVLALDAAEAGALAVELAVPESWFFRGGRALFARIADIVSVRAAARPPGQGVRVLCAPCSTGEEPYSVAIACHEAYVPAAALRIDAVDLSTRHLDRAAAGRFPAFSFRETGPDIRPAHFRPVGDHWELLPHLRRQVRFRNANLTDPNFLSDEPPYDVIFCRNVFIYLTPEGRARAMASLDRLLAPDGALCLTPGEADRLPPGQFTASGDTGLYRRSTAVIESRFALPAPLTSPPVVRPRVFPVVAAPPAPSPQVPAPPAPVAVVAPKPAALDAARALADAGQLDEARLACERMLRDAPSSAAVHSLVGLIELAQGRTDAAAEAFRRALYSDPECEEALEHMIVISDRKGNAAQAAALRRRLARLSREDAP